MSSYEDPENDGEIIADEWAPYREAYSEAPIETLASLAAGYAAQAAQAYTPDPEAIAVQALVHMGEIQRAQAETQQANAEAQLIDRSLAAQYGDEYVSLTPEIVHRLSHDEELQREWAKTRNTQQRADLLEREFKSARDEARVAKFKSVMDAPSNKLGL